MIQNETLESSNNFCSELNTELPVFDENPAGGTDKSDNILNKTKGVTANETKQSIINDEHGSVLSLGMENKSISEVSLSIKKLLIN